MFNEERNVLIKKKNRGRWKFRRVEKSKVVYGRPITKWTLWRDNDMLVKVKIYILLRKSSGQWLRINRWKKRRMINFITGLSPSVSIHLLLKIQITKVREYENTVTAWKVSKYGVISSLYFPVFRLKTEIYEVNLRIQSKYRKIRTRDKSVFGHFSRSACFKP